MLIRDCFSRFCRFFTHQRHCITGLDNKAYKTSLQATLTVVLLATICSACKASGGSQANQQVTSMTEKTDNTAIQTLDLPLTGQGKTLSLLIKGIQHSRDSFTVRFYLNAPHVPAQQLISNNDYYAGTFYMYGHGDAVESGKTINTLESFDHTLDISLALKHMRDNTNNRLSIVVTDQQGQPLTDAAFVFDSIELVAK